MNTTLTVKGMHCEACQKLIVMELEDAGIEKEIANVNMKEDKIGVITFNDVTEEEVTHIKDVINSMDGYSVS